MKRRAIIGIGIIVVAALIGGLWWRTSARPVAAPLPASTVGRAVVTDATGNLLLVGTDGSSQQLTSDASRSRSYGQITPAPDGQHVAYVVVEAGRALLQVQPLAAGEARTLYESFDARPFYLAWSPDSRTIAFLASDSTMNLYLVGADGSNPPREIREGQPSYFAWADDSTRLLLHTGGGAPQGSITQHTVANNSLYTFAEPPGDFQTPAWNSDGTVRYVVLTDGMNNRLVRVEGDKQTDLTFRLVNPLVFSLSPDRSKIAYMTMSNARPSVIQIVDATGGTPTELPSTAPIAFFWSPDGKQIAALAVDPQGVGPTGDRGVYTVAQNLQLRVHWEVTTIADNTQRRFVPFIPSNEFLNLVPYFDQYATSVSFWSPDSTHLIYGAANGVWSLNTADGKTTKLSDGTQGFWVP